MGISRAVIRLIAIIAYSVFRSHPFACSIHKAIIGKWQSLFLLNTLRLRLLPRYRPLGGSSLKRGVFAAIGSLILVAQGVSRLYSSLEPKTLETAALVAVRSGLVWSRVQTFTRTTVPD
jgi:hypothetical protein